MSSSDKSRQPPSTPNPPRIDSVEPVASTKWLALQTLQWTDQDGQPRQWDMATRTTKQSHEKADAVVVIPLLRHHNKDDNPTSTTVETLLVEQYRPPVRQTTVEFPAGLIDAHETVEQAALRELREETGYVGEACKVPPLASRATCMSPGLCDESVQVVLVEVDLSNPYNHGTPKVRTTMVSIDRSIYGCNNVFVLDAAHVFIMILSPLLYDHQPELDPGEHCVVKRVSLQEGLKQILDQGTAMPIMGLYLFALGWELGASATTSLKKET